MAEEQTKGQSFLTQSFLKNQAFANKNEDVGALNRTMSSFTVRNIRALDSLTKQMTQLNQNILKLSKPSQTKKDFVKREDYNLRLIKEVDDLEELMEQSVKMNKKENENKKRGILGLIGNIAGIAGIGGLVGYLLFGQDKYIKKAREIFANVGGMIWDGFKTASGFVWENIKDWWTNKGGKELTNETAKTIGDGLITGVKTAWNWAMNNKAAAGIGGLLGFLLTGNIGTLASLSLGFGNLAINAMRLMLTNPQASIIIASAATVAYAAWKAKDLKNSSDKVKKDREERDLKEKERWLNRANLQNLKMEDRERLNKNLESSDLLSKALMPTPSGNKILFGWNKFKGMDAAWEPNIKAAEKMGLFNRYDIIKEFAPNGWTKEAKIKAMQYEVNRLAQERGRIFKPYGQFTENLSTGNNALSLNRIVDTYGSVINEASKKYGVDPNLIASVISQESAGNQFAVSHAGAQGLMQLMPKTAKSLGVADSFDINQNIFGGTKLLSDLLNKYKDPSLALMAYNAGEPRVDNYLKGIGKPLADETLNYAPSILKKYESLNSSNNLPMMMIPMTNQNKKDDKFNLGIETIEKLSNAIGASVKNAFPTSSKPVVSIDTSIRG